ncbi:MAG: DUF58 domain-containing protein [Chloroflexi bacterium]|nr:DUF58 domain-containing protein [Chloroflexota bacterium]
MRGAESAPGAGADLAFDEAFLRRLERMSLRLGRVSQTVGGRPGSRRVPAADFIDHRPYSPGDDLRHIDWNAAARHDEVFVKVGRVMQSADVQLVLDASLSMAVLPLKWQRARQLAAALGWMSLAHGDRVGLTVFPQHPDDAPAGASRGIGPAREMLRRLARLEPVPSESTALTPVLERSIRGRPGGLVVVISDFWLVDDLDRALALAPLPRWNLLLLQVLDPAELRPELDGAFELIDAESGARRSLNVDAAMRAAYRQALLRRLELLGRVASRHGASHALLPASWSIEQAIIPYLQRRAILEGRA